MTTTNSLLPVIPCVSYTVHETEYAKPEVKAQADLSNVLYVQCVDGSILERKRTLTGHYFKNIQSPHAKLVDKVKPSLVIDFQHLPNGKKIPKALLDQITSFFARVALDSREEVMAHILYNTLTGEYEVGIPLQLIYGAAVDYKFVDVKPYHNVIVDIHSHNYMSSFWSGQDNKDDEKGVWYSAVFGSMGTAPSISWRFTVEGTFYKVDPVDIFDEYSEVVTDAPFPQSWYKRIALTEKTTKLVKLAFPTEVPPEISKFALYTELDKDSQDWITAKLRASFRSEDPMQGLKNLPSPIQKVLESTLAANKAEFKSSFSSFGGLGSFGRYSYGDMSYEDNGDNDFLWRGINRSSSNTKGVLPFERRKYPTFKEIDNLDLKYYSQDSLIVDGCSESVIYLRQVIDLLNIDSLTTDPSSREYLDIDIEIMKIVSKFVHLDYLRSNDKEKFRFKKLKEVIYLHLRCHELSKSLESASVAMPSQVSLRKSFFTIMRKKTHVSTVKKLFIYLGAILGPNLDKNLSEVIFYIYNLGQEYLPKRYKEGRDATLVSHLSKIAEILGKNYPSNDNPKDNT